MLYSLTTNNSICHQNIKDNNKTYAKPAKPSIPIVKLLTAEVET